MIVASHPVAATPRDGESRDGEPNATLLRSIAILAPTGRDAQVTMQVLAGAGVHPVRCDDIRALCDAIDAGVGAVLVTEEALGAEAVRALLAALDRQPSWSDIPLLVLASAVGLRQGVSPRLAHLMEHANVTLLERPVRVATLVTSLQASLRARRWQFDLRDQLEALRETQRTLLESERTLRLAREEAESANRIKSEFLAVMSHELRTPLNAIGGYAELLALGVRGPVTREQREDLERIRRSQQHLLGLINEVLNYARIEAGSVRYTIDDVPLGDAVAYVLMLVTPQANDKGLSLFHDEDELRGLVARADGDKIRQILLNLLSNAVKFTHRGGRITITGRTVPGKVILDVTDTGIGISGNQLEQVFEPFVQVNSTLTRTQEGTGLGLAISRDLARGMGGELTAHSTLGEGSTFTLTLPCAPA